MASARFNVTTPRWIRWSLPRMKTLFEQRADGDGRFPIFSPRQQEKAFRHAPIPTDPNREAAVLIPVVSVSDVPSILFTKRSSDVTTHKSEISFPGGHREGGETLVEAALRETEEECGGSWSSHAIILGQCTKIPSIRGTPVTPVLGVLPLEFADHQDLMDRFLRPNPREVSAVFTVSVRTLVESETTEPLGRLATPAPIFPSPHGEIWGLTSFVLKPILRHILKPTFLGQPKPPTQVPPTSTTPL